jgi:hypothetical protein
MRRTLDAIRYLDSIVVEAKGIEGLALRYGGFYGPETSISEGGEHWEAVRRRRFPIVGGGGGVWSFVHIDDAAAATMAAMERGRPGIYNVVDDDPAPVAAWLPALAAAIGAKPPRRLPAWVGRLAAGEHGLVMMTEIRGASNAKAKRELGWTPSIRPGARTSGRWRRALERPPEIDGAGCPFRHDPRGPGAPSSVTLESGWWSGVARGGRGLAARPGVDTVLRRVPSAASEGC